MELLYKFNTTISDQFPSSTLNTITSQPIPAHSQNKLTNIKKNADRISPKLPEPRYQLKICAIDLFTIQESKLRSPIETPYNKGYVTLKKDQNKVLAGSLLS